MRKWGLAAGALMALAVGGCGGGDKAEPGTTSGAQLSGNLGIDGSSTVFPVSQAVAEEFMKEHPGVNITVNESGTGGGMKKFTAGEIEITGASRPIDSKEIEACQTNGIEFVEIPLAFDGLSVVVNPANTWVDHLTVEELKKIWAPESKIDNWSQVRAGFPDVPLKLFGPGTDSGTFEYFTEAIIHTKKASRADYQASEDDNVLVQGVAGEKGGLGYFGYAYFVENKDKLKLVPVEAGSGPVAPSEATIADASYQPLSRPLFLYISKKTLSTDLGKALIDYYLGDKGLTLIGDVGYVPLPTGAYDMIKARVAAKKTGSLFAAGNWVGSKIEEVLSRG